MRLGVLREIRRPPKRRAAAHEIRAAQCPHVKLMVRAAASNARRPESDGRRRAMYEEIAWMAVKTSLVAGVSSR